MEGVISMKRIQGFLAAAALFAVAYAPAAHATPITGQLSLTGGNDINIAAHTITFNFGNPTNSATETGSFSTLGTGLTVLWEHQGSPIDYTALTAGSNLGCGGGCLFEVRNASNLVVADFDLTTEFAPVVSGGFLNLSGTGTARLNGFDNTLVTFSLSTQGGSGTNLTFSSTVAVPAPVLGAGLPGLVAACGGLLALARRRRQKFA
jgi:hypothetical protein